MKENLISQRSIRTSSLLAQNNAVASSITSVTICVCTYRRPGQLKRLLEATSNQTFISIPKPEIAIVVVDNDHLRSAENVCLEYSNKAGIELVYDVVTERNIAKTRNRTLELASERSNFVALIDDDEFPEPCWLDNLLAAQKSFKADIVIGPVLPVYSVETPSWVINGDFFALPRFPTGKRLNDGLTGNALISCEMLSRLGLRFDIKLGLTGGEDQFFFRQAHALGASIVYANEAIVHEDVPLSRSNVPYILRRQFRVGNTLSLSDLSLDPSLLCALRRFFKASARLFYGMAYALVALLRFSRTAFVRGGCDVSRGLGMLAGLVGYRYMEYKKPPI